MRKLGHQHEYDSRSPQFQSQNGHFIGVRSTDRTVELPRKGGSRLAKREIIVKKGGHDIDKNTSPRLVALEIEEVCLYLNDDHLAVVDSMKCRPLKVKYTFGGGAGVEIGWTYVPRMKTLVDPNAKEKEYKTKEFNEAVDNFRVHCASQLCGEAMKPQMILNRQDVGL